MCRVLIFRKLENQLLSVCISTSKVEPIVDLDCDSLEGYSLDRCLTIIMCLRSVSDHPANSTFAVMFPEATIEGSVMSSGILWDGPLSRASAEGSNCPLALKPHATRTTDMARGLWERAYPAWESGVLIAVLSASYHLGIPGTSASGTSSFNLN